MTLIESLRGIFRRGIFSDQVDEGRRKALQIMGVTLAAAALTACGGNQPIQEATTKEKIGFPKDKLPLLYFDEWGARVLDLQKPSTIDHLKGKLDETSKIINERRQDNTIYLNDESIKNHSKDIGRDIKAKPVVCYYSNEDGLSVTSVFIPDKEGDLSGDGRLVVFLDGTRHETYAFAHANLATGKEKIKIKVDYRTGEITETAIEHHPIDDDRIREGVANPKKVIRQYRIPPPNCPEPVVLAGGTFINEFPNISNLNLDLDLDLLNDPETAADVLEVLLFFIARGLEIPTVAPYGGDLVLRPLTYEKQPGNVVVVPKLYGSDEVPDQIHQGYEELRNIIEALTIKLPPIGSAPRLFMIQEENKKEGKVRVKTFAVDYKGEATLINTAVADANESDKLASLWPPEPSHNLLNSQELNVKDVVKKFLDILKRSEPGSDWQAVGLWSAPSEEVKYCSDIDRKVRYGITVSDAHNKEFGRIFIIPETWVEEAISSASLPTVPQDPDGITWPAIFIPSIIDDQAREALAKGFNHLGPGALPLAHLVRKLLQVESSSKANVQVCVGQETKVYKVEIGTSISDPVYVVRKQAGTLSPGDLFPVDEIRNIGGQWYALTKRIDLSQVASHYLNYFITKPENQPDLDILAIPLDLEEMTFQRSRKFIKADELVDSLFNYHEDDAIKELYIDRNKENTDNSDEHNLMYSIELDWRIKRRELIVKLLQQALERK